jgi:hypothetical protein
VLDNWDKIPDTSTVWSEEGTAAHEVAAAYLQNRKPDTASLKAPIDADMFWHGWNYSEYVQDLLHPGGKLLVEQKMPLWYMPGRNAIVDAAVVNPDALHIVDYKYGEGVAVSPVESLQATIYAAVVASSKVANLHKDFSVTLHIYQPRGRASEDGPAHSWSTSWGNLGQLVSLITDKANAIQAKRDLVFAPSEKACQWCPAKGFCSERQKTLTQEIEVLATIDENEKTFPHVKSISAAQTAAVLKHKAAIIKWLNDVEAFALEHLKAGHTLPGFKLVLSRGGNRYWTNPQAAAKALLENTILKRSEVIEEKVIGPAAAEKLLGKNKMPVEVLNLISKPPGQPVIAPEDDKRESCFAQPQLEFSPIE